MKIFQFRVYYLLNLRDGICCDANISLVSSTNILGEALSRQLGKSFMYIKNNRGPKLRPCGTPQVIIAVSDNSPLTQHL